MNKNGVSIMELLAYMALAGLVSMLLTGILTFTIQSYDKVNGEGAMYTEANFIMSTLISKANSFNPQYIRECDTNCVELVIETEKVIDYDLGLLIDVPVNKTSQIKLVKKSEDVSNKVYDIYLGGLRLNNKGFGIYFDEKSLVNSGSINFSCYDDSSGYSDICQSFVLTLKLSLVRINDYNVIISEKPYIFENRFSF